VQGRCVVSLLERLRNLEAKWGDDPENVHMEADKILCELLRSYGDHDIVEAFEALPRWYA